MKILAVSDEVVEILYSPLLKERYADVDLVLGCGDLPFYYLEYIVTVLDVPLLYVHGNHDRLAQFRSDGRVVHRAEGCVSIDGQAVRLPLAYIDQRRTPAPGKDLLLAGLGGSMRYNLDGVHQYSEGQMAARALQLAPRLLLNRLRYGRSLDILVTHASPRGIHDAPDPAHIGFNTFLRAMGVFRPRLLLHGHSHVYRSDTVTRTRYRQTQVINVYPYRLIEWKGGGDD